MNNLEYERKKKITIIVVATIIVVLSILLAIVLATNSGNEVPTSAEEVDNRIHQTEVPEGYTPIETASQLADISSNLTGNYILMDDIDLAEIENFEVIGKSSSSSFKGIFDGNNYKISNLNIESDNQYVGLFGYVENGTIKNVTLENVTVTSTYKQTTNKESYVGGIVGCTYSNTKIDNVSIIGQSSVSTAEIAEDETVANRVYIGGLVGYNKGTINTSYATGAVTANTTTGAIDAGGLVGHNVGTVNTSYATGAVTANTTTGAIDAGGLVGESGYTISDTFATGSVSANSTTGAINAGGLVGQNSKIIKNTYAVGKVVSNGDGTKNVGGLVGNKNNYVTVTSSYWSPETTGQQTSATTTEKAMLFQSMLQQGTYTDSGWDFTEETGVWQIEEGETLPYLRSLEKPDTVNKNKHKYTQYQGDGTEENPFIITSEEELQGMRNKLDAHYKLGNDIEIKDIENFNAIGQNETYSFTGILDGAGHKIIGLNMKSANQYVGLFGYVENGTIKNLTLENVNVKSEYTTNVAYLGTLAGYTRNATIENVSVAGTTKVEHIEEGTNSKYLGGLVGRVYGGSISASNSNVNIIAKSGDIYAGGLVGACANNEISKSYSNTNINIGTCNTVWVGGIIGGISQSAVIYKDYQNRDIVIETSINQVYSSGNITVSDSAKNVYAGGVVGYLSSKATSPIATGNNYAKSSIGLGSSYSVLNIDIEGTEHNTLCVGGLVGYRLEGGTRYERYSSQSEYYSFCMISDCYAVGNINSTNGKGLIGFNSNGSAMKWGDSHGTVINNVSSSYWAPETVEQYEDANTNVKPKQLQTMFKQSTYKGWNFDTIWAIDEGKSLPYLRALGKPEELNNYTHKIYNEGEGTEDNPYIITNEEQLQAMRNEPDIYYKIANDIYIQNIENFEPICQTRDYPFSGTLDGAGYKVTGLNIESDNQYVGMFGYVSGGIIKDLTLENVIVKSTYTNTNATENVGYIGAIAGKLEGEYNVSKENIKNVKIIGDSSVSNTEGANTVYIGGLVGASDYYSTTITNTSSTAKVTANSTSGAINAGGLVGYAVSANIINAYSTGKVTANSTSGAINAGGLVGYKSSGTVKNTYAVGRVETTTTGTKNLGGLIGSGSGTVENSYWSPETTGEYKSATKGERAKLLQSMIHRNTFTDWDFENVWGIVEGETLPYLRDLEIPEEVNKYKYSYTKYEGEGTEENPYIITNEEQLQGMINELDAHYKLGNDIVLENNFEPIGKSTKYPFNGTLDGAGFTIKNMNIVSDNQYVGMLGYAENATIKNIVLEKVNVTSTLSSTNTAMYLGGVIGYAKTSTIDNVTVIGKVEKTEGKYTLHIGGIAGYLDKTNITNSEANITLNASSTGGVYSGGIAGYVVNASNIENTISKGNIVSDATSNYNYVGGIIGYANGGTLLKSYSVADVTSDQQGTIHIGGAIGYAVSITVNEIYSTGEVKATTNSTVYAGGLVGYNSSANITDAYTTSRVFAQGNSINAGGLIGYRNSGTVKNTYAVGRVEVTTTGTSTPNVGGLIGAGATPTPNNPLNSYWSAGATGQAESKGGVEKDTQSLLHLTGYDKIEDVGGTWNFEDTWTIEDGNSLAYLKNLEKADGINQEDLEYNTRKPVYVKDTKDIGIKGAEIVVKNAEGEEVRRGTSNSNGIFYILNLEAGVYTVEEAKAADGYKLNNVTIAFELTEESLVVNPESKEEIKLEIINEPITLSIKNTDEEGNALQGSTIGLVDDEGNILKGLNGREVKGTTDKEGNVVLSNIKAGTYKYKQISPVRGYKLNENTYTLTIAEDGAVTFGEENQGIIINEKILKSITITKTGEIINSDETVNLKGAEILLYNQNGTEREIKETNVDGQVTFENLEVGTYSYREISAPEGYAVNTTRYYVRVNQDETVEFLNGSNGVIHNNLKKAKYTIEHYKQNDTLDGYEKVNEDTEEKLGLSGETVTAESKTYPGYYFNPSRSKKTGIVKTDGTLVLKMYYDKVESTEFNINIKNVVAEERNTNRRCSV